VGALAGGRCRSRARTLVGSPASGPAAVPYEFGRRRVSSLGERPRPARARARRSAMPPTARPAPVPTTADGGRPPMVDRATWQAARDAHLVREKAHTRAWDAIAAARRRLPMVVVD